MKVLVTGAGGAIGGHLVRRLVDDGHQVRAVDLKPLSEWFQIATSEYVSHIDLKDPVQCEHSVAGMEYVFNLAADMGGMGFIENNKLDCMLSSLITTNMLLASENAGVERFFQASSACVYPDYRQNTTENISLKEEDAYPAMPEDGYGWEKLYGERMCHHFNEETDLETRVARYHNVYAPYASWTGGREKAPSAICRKIAEAKLYGDDQIEIWGDGEQVRSFMYVDDCIDGTMRLMNSSVSQPLNIGSNESVTINQLVDIVEDIARVKLKRVYNKEAPQGVRGRNSDNTLVQELLGWQPSISLRDGLEVTFEWIYNQVKNLG